MKKLTIYIIILVMLTNCDNKKEPIQTQNDTSRTWWKEAIVYQIFQEVDIQWRIGV